MVSVFKYSLVGNFNVHNHAWRGLKIDDELITRACNAYHMIILNDGSSTFVSFSGLTNLVIDLSISSRDLAILIEVVTESDLYSSDHFSVNKRN